MKTQALLTSTYSSHQFPSLFLHVNSQECPQTARRNQSHQQSVEGEVQLRFSSQAFQPIHSESTHYLQACHATGLPTINIAPRELCSWFSKHYQFPSLFLHVNSQECPQTARRNQSHQQSVEGEVQLRFSSQAFQPIHSESTHSLQAYHATGLPAINIAPRELCSWLSKHFLHLLAVVTSFRPYFCMSIAKNFLRQPVAISLISNQWKEKYNCAFHPRHSNQSTQNPLTLFKLTVFTKRQALLILTVVTSFHLCFCMSKAKNALRQPVAISLISNQWKEKYNCAFHPRHSNQSTLSLSSSFSSLPCYWSTCNQYRSKSISFTKCKVLGFSTGFKNKEEGHQDTGPHVLFFFMRLWSYWCFLGAARGIRHSLEVRLFTLSILQNLHLGR